MNLNNILNASIEAFKQKFMGFCQNSDFSQNTSDEDTFANLTSQLMDASRAAG